MALLRRLLYSGRCYGFLFITSRTLDYGYYRTSVIRNYAKITSVSEEHWTQPRKPEFKNTLSNKFNRNVKKRRFESAEIDGDEIEASPVMRSVDTVFEETFPTDRRLSIDDCVKFRETVVNNTRRSIDDRIPLSLDANILQTFDAKKFTASGLSYVEFLLAKDLLNPGCIEPASRLIKDRFTADEYTRSEAEMLDNLSSALHEKVTKVFPKSMQLSLMVPVMTALVCSSRWTEALSWLKSNDPSTQYWPILNVLIIKAFMENQPSIGLKSFEDLCSSCSVLPTDGRIVQALLKYLNSIVDKNNGKDSVDILNGFVDILRDRNLPSFCISDAIVADVKKLFSKIKKPGYVVLESKVLSGGQCSSCHQHLQKVTLSTDEFQSLKLEAVDLFVEKMNIHRWSTPKELMRFERMLLRTEGTASKGTGRFDIIVDGLNVLHSGVYNHGPERVKKLIHVLKQLKGNPNIPANKILVLIRPYVKLERYQAMAEEINSMATVFVCEHQSVDDSYLIYGTLLSGENCYFVTNDLLRQQNSMFSAKGSMIFQKWRKLRQIQFNWRSKDAHAMWPFDYAVYPQRNGKSYHFPLENNFDDTTSKFDIRAQEEAMTWLCVKPRSC